MKKVFPSVLLSLALFSSAVHADIVDVTGTRWPIPAWQIEGNTQERMASKQCQNFLNFSMKSKKFLTEGLVVIKDGKIQYEGYESKYDANTPHILWSVSKTITGALLGIAVRDGKVSLDQALHEFYPRPDAGENYQKITLKNLFYLDTGFIWDEYYTGDVTKSPVLSMLYSAHKDIAGYAIDKPIIKQGPGYKWNYSTGTPAITMGVLKGAYGEDYNEMPWKSLFNPLGMTNIRFEQDHEGVFNGGSSAFATPREMAKLGYLYLNNGKWNGEEILTPEWIAMTKSVSPGYLSEGTVIRDITDDGVYGGSIWLNKAVKKGFGKPYPASPDDMMLALGHYGQIVVILPTQKMVIARTGYDQEYNSKVDEFVSRAIACFDNPAYPIGKEIPPPKYSKITPANIYKTIKTGMKTNVFQAAVAKTICSCHFISKMDVKTCVDRSNIPLAKKLTKVSVSGNVVTAERSALAKVLIGIFGIGRTHSKAVFNKDHPELGCTLM